MSQPSQPNFPQLAQSLNDAAHQISLVPNLHGINHGQQITDQLQQIGVQLQNITFQQTRIIEQLNRHSGQLARLENNVAELRRETASISTRIDVNDANAFARLQNSAISKFDSTFSPLRDRQNRLVDGFPKNGAVLMSLSTANIIALLRAFELDEMGNMATRLQRFRQFIGVVRDF